MVKRLLALLLIFDVAVCFGATPTTKPKPKAKPTPGAVKPRGAQPRGVEAYYVSWNAVTGQDGSIKRPWTLFEAVNQKSSTVSPGATIYLRGGARVTATPYTFPPATNPYVQLQGTSGSGRITIRNYPGEYVRIDVKNATNGFFYTNAGGTTPCYSNHVSWEGVYPGGMEFFSSNTTPLNGTHRKQTFRILCGAGIRVINTVIHDTNDGIATSTSNVTDAVIYGNLTYYIGDNTNQSHDFYIDRDVGPLVENNIMHNGSGPQMHGYSGGTNHTYRKNVSFFSGQISGLNLPSMLFLVGGTTRFTNPIIDQNYTFALPGQAVMSYRHGANRVGYSAGCSNPTMTNNFLRGKTVLTGCSERSGITGELTLTGNTFYGDVKENSAKHGAQTDVNLSCCGYSGNVKLTRDPASQTIAAWPNAYQTDPARGTIVVYNWTGASTASVDVSSILAAQDTYVIWDTMDFFGADVATGTYSGSPISIPIVARAAAVPLAAPALTNAEGNNSIAFKVFIIQKTGVSGAPR